MGNSHTKNRAAEVIDALLWLHGLTVISAVQGNNSSGHEVINA